MILKKLKLSTLAGAVLISTGAMALPITTDIVTVVDESGSMGGEHAWLGTMISDLGMALSAAAGADTLNDQYGLVGFGGSSSHLYGHVHDMDNLTAGTQEWGSTAQYSNAVSGLVLNGGTEDGYSGMNAALAMTGQANSVRNIILVTDEDRDVTSGTNTTAQQMTDALAQDKALLNAVLNVSIKCGDGTFALGVDSNGTGYKADGDGGFTTCENAYQYGGFGTSIADYGNLALATGGAVWDLNKLRLGGNTAMSFTAAFVDVKIKETIDVIVNVAEPGTFALLGLGLAGLVSSRRRKSKA